MSSVEEEYSSQGEENSSASENDIDEELLEEEENSSPKELSENEQDEEEEEPIDVEFPTQSLKDNTSQYSEKELQKLISSKSPEVTAILSEIISRLPALKEQMKKVEDIVSSLPSSLENGVSLLDLKSEFLLSYNQLLYTYILQKLEGADLKNHPLFESLVRSRSLLEKLEPLELKMKTQIDSILHPQQESNTTNPLSFHANLDDLDSSSEEESKNETDNKTKLYVPPKIAVVPYSEKDSERDAKRREDLKERIASNAFISELRNEVSNRPDVINMKSTGDRELDRELKERTDFEESNYVRVTLSKAQKKKMKQAALNMQRGRKMDDFDEYDSLTRLVKESEKITSQVIDEDEFGNRFKRVNEGMNDQGRKNKRRRGNNKKGRS